MYVEENLEEVFKNIKKAKQKSKFNQNVDLIAVTKTVEYDLINRAITAGIRHIGENKVQEIQRKYDSINEPVNWHLIGSLQTNKVKYIADKVFMIHSVDRIELAAEIDKQAKKCNRVIDCLIQVKISEEDTKHGVDVDETEDLIKNISLKYENVRICGLMGMAPYMIDSEETRPYFRKLKNLFDEISGLNIEHVDMMHLSMGMSNDFEIAIEEGATFVRVGTKIFGEREYN